MTGSKVATKVEPIGSNQKSDFSRISFWISICLLLAAFAQTLWPSWHRGGYYDFGWLVPIIVLVLLVMRVGDMASVRPDLGKGPRIAGGVLFVLMLVGLVPLQLLHWVDPVWRLPLWVHTGLIVGITFYVLYLEFGFRKALSFLPILVLLFTAVPLPSFIETPLIQKLTRWVVEIGHTSLVFAGYPIEQVGNLLVAKGQPLDVSEACSGVRSFQSSAMLGLCLGEFIRGSWWERILLFSTCLLLAVLGNAIRIFLLGRKGYLEGVESVDLAHDNLGLLVLLLIYAGAGATAFLLKRRDRQSVRRRKTTKVSV